MFRAKGFILSLVFSTFLFLGKGQLFAQSAKIEISEGTALTVTGNLQVSNMFYMTKSNQDASLKFVEGSSWTGASTGRFIDGNVTVDHNDPFVFPVGANQLYRPVGIDGAANTSVSFFNKSPEKISTGTFENKEIPSSAIVEQLSKEGYWSINGEQPTAITLSYGVETQLEALTQGDLEKLSIVGLRNGQWEVIPSTLDNVTLNGFSTTESKPNFITGSITTNSQIVPNNYEYVTLAAIGNTALVETTTFSMYPNPNLTRLPLNVEYQLAEQGEATLRIHAASGALLVERTLQEGNGVITLSDVTNTLGTYSVSIIDSKGEAVTKKLIVASE